MEENQLRYLLALLQLPGIGPATIAKIQKTNKDLSLLFNEKGQYLLPLPLKEEMGGEKSAREKPNWSWVDADLEWARQPGCRILTLDDPLYPDRLKNIHSAPALLYVQGNPLYLNQPQIAIVGTRNPTRDGKLLAFEFAEYFARMGFTVTSGLALGIDAAAHRGALKGAALKELEVLGAPKGEAKAGTIAVLGNGLARIYPKSHLTLSQEILEHGALVSEFSVQEAPDATHFPRRNRIISGLSLGTLVVEAALKSGSLITAQYALDQGREVFAIPGSIHNPLAKGCHQLIQQGAKLIQTAEDVLVELAGQLELPGLQCRVRDYQDQPQDISLKKGLAELLDRVSYGALSTVDALAEGSGLTVSIVSSMLLELELMGRVVAVPGGYMRASSRDKRDL